MNRFLIAFACFALALPAAAETVSESTGVNSALGVSPSTADFVKEAAISDMFELKSSELASQRDPSSKAFAERMVTDHTKTSDEMKSFVNGGKVQATIPTDLDSSHKGMLTTLEGLKGGEFAKQYKSDQVSAHKSAVDLFKRYSSGGANSTLKAWAAKTLPTLEHHLQMAQDQYNKS